MIASIVGALLTIGMVVLALAPRPSGREVVSGSHARKSAEPDLVDVAEGIARDVRSGVGLRSAVASALDSAPTLLAAVASALQRDATLTDALSRHRPRGDEPDVVVHALQLAAQHPHLAGRILDRAVTVVRERRAWRHERQVHSAQAHASARMLTILPLAFALWGVATSSSVRSAYMTSSTVGVVAVLGLVLNLVGWWWMRRIVDADT